MALLSIQISEKARAFASAQAATRGLRDAAEYAASLLEQAADRYASQGPLTDFHDAKTDLDALIAAQGVKPIADPGELVADFWPAEESADDFIAAVRKWRQTQPEPEPKP